MCAPSIMGKIVLRPMRFYAYHGFYEEEKIIGGYYTVEVSLSHNFAVASVTDDLYQTINYEIIYLICKLEMKRSVKLLETLADRINDALNTHLKAAKDILVIIRKENPPLGGKVGAAMVSISKDDHIIGLENIFFNANHGFYPEEQLLENDFSISVYITTNFGVAAAADDLYQTINYETIYEICRAEMQFSTKLIETLAERILERLKRQFGRMRAARIQIQKLNPALGGLTTSVAVEIADEFISNCGRCKKEIFCYGDTNCWCQNREISPYTQSMINLQFKGCLCNDCITFYAGK